MKTDLKVGDHAIVIKIDPMPNNHVAPALTMDEDYEVLAIHTDRGGNDHIDIGIKMKGAIGSVSSWDTGEVLPNTSDQWWCHPSRFRKL